MLLQEKPNYLALVGSEHEIRLFYQQSLKNWLNSIFPATHSNGGPWLFNPKTTQWTSDPTEITNPNQPQNSGLEKPNPQHKQEKRERCHLNLKIAPLLETRKIIFSGKIREAKKAPIFLRALMIHGGSYVYVRLQIIAKTCRQQLTPNPPANP